MRQRVYFSHQRKTKPHDDASVFRAKRLHSCRNFIGNTSRYQRSNLRTEVVLRKEKLTPEKLETIRDATAALSSDDKEVLKHVFYENDTDETGLLIRPELHQAIKSLGITCTDQELDHLLAFAGTTYSFCNVLHVLTSLTNLSLDADGSKAIDLEEWLMLAGLLIQPPYDIFELSASFQVLFEAQQIPVSTFRQTLENVLQVALGPSESAQLPQFLDEITSTLDPETSGLISAEASIQRLLTPYAARVPPVPSVGDT